MSFIDRVFPTITQIDSPHSNSFLSTLACIFFITPGEILTACMVHSRDSRGEGIGSFAFWD
ncbi:MAG TPA: hypothetical protein VJW55_19630 [Candidatus Angelobacter sp.]|nr:hypothetical protein [Candidatus Angelobacter sp.]